MNIHAIVRALLAGLFLTAGAEARPDSRTMACEQIQANIEDEKVLVMDTGPQTYKRFVHHQGYCSVAEVISDAWVDAADGQCQLRECRIRREDGN